MKRIARRTAAAIFFFFALPAHAQDQTQEEAEATAAPPPEIVVVSGDTSPPPPRPPKPVRALRIDGGYVHRRLFDIPINGGELALGVAYETKHVYVVPGLRLNLGKTENGARRWRSASTSISCRADYFRVAAGTGSEYGLPGSAGSSAFGAEAFTTLFFFVAPALFITAFAGTTGAEVVSTTIGAGGGTDGAASAIGEDDGGGAETAITRRGAGLSSVYITSTAAAVRRTKSIPVRRTATRASVDGPVLWTGAKLPVPRGIGIDAICSGPHTWKVTGADDSSGRGVDAGAKPIGVEYIGMRGGLGYVVASCGPTCGAMFGTSGGGGIDIPAGRDPAIIVVGCGGASRGEDGGGETTGALAAAPTSVPASIVIACGTIAGDDGGAFAIAIDAPVTIADGATGFEDGGIEGGGGSGAMTASVSADRVPTMSFRTGLTTERTDSTSDVIASGFGARDGRGGTGRMDGLFRPSFGSGAREAVDMEFSREGARTAPGSFAVLQATFARIRREISPFGWGPRDPGGRTRDPHLCSFLLVDREERRKQILTLARDVFAKRGYHAAKIDDIVAAAGVARGTFYLYFEDKRAIFEEIVDGTFARLGAAVMRVDTEHPTRTVTDQIKENIHRIVHALLEDPATTKILLSDAVGLDPEFDRKLLSFYEQVGKLLEESLRDGQSRGIVTKGDAHMFAVMTLGAVKEVMYQVVMRDLANSEEQIVESIFSFLSAGYLRVA